MVLRPIPVPVPFSTFGQVGGTAKSLTSLVSVPRIALLMAIAAAFWGWPTATKKLVKSSGTHQGKYLVPTYLWVDKATNTLLKDQSLEAGLGRPRTLPNIVEVHSKLNHDYTKEQLRAPGVRLVAHTVQSGAGDELYEVDSAWNPARRYPYTD